ncbi:hypothetical protein [Pedobacter sp.]|uniref:hypothetical protein n=1 Tax=Pedobacter sp. TaxID=1411316 RepID=UPI003D7F72A0
MQLHFSLLIDKKPNYFVAKIWSSILNGLKVDENEPADYLQYLSPDDRSRINNVKPKLHTIRSDKTHSWKKGMSIQPVIGKNAESYRQFTPDLKCLNVQTIRIETVKDSTPDVIIDGKKLPLNKIQLLAHNDGFDDVNAFFSYFKGQYTGKLIHWTTLIY